MISQPKAHLELSGQKQNQVVHFWEGEVKPYSLGESGAQIAKKIEQLQEFQTKIVSALQKHLDMLWGKDKVLQLQAPQQLSLKSFFSENKAEDQLGVSWGMGGSAFQGFLFVEKNFFYFLYSFIFGGNHFVEKTTPPSKLEKNYFEQFSNDFLDIASQAWKSLGAYSLKSEKFFLDSESISKIVSPNDFILIRFEVTAGEAKYAFSLLYPKDLLTLFDENKGQEAGGGVTMQRDEQWEKSVLNAVSVSSSVKVQAQLGIVPLLLSQALNLQVGQVLPLKVNEEGHLVYVNDNKAYLGKMGSLGECRAIQIT